MNARKLNFGPWTTSLDSGSRLQLSAFWKQRMRQLPRLSAATRMSRGTLLAALVLAIAVGLSPLVELVPAAPNGSAGGSGFVVKFSNGATVELVGLSENPSAGAPWWKPDGTPLDDRPYHRVMARMGSTGSLAREIGAGKGSTERTYKRIGGRYRLITGREAVVAKTKKDETSRDSRPKQLVCLARRIRAR